MIALQIRQTTGYLPFSVDTEYKNQQILLPTRYPILFALLTVTLKRKGYQWNSF